MPKPNLDDTQCGFRLGCRTTDHTCGQKLSHSPTHYLRNLESMPNMIFCTPRKSIRPGSSRKELGDFGGTVVLTNFFRCPPGYCIPTQTFASSVKSKPYADGVGFQHGCVLSPLLIFYTNWTDTRSPVDEGATVGSCKSTVYFCKRFGAVFIFSTGSFQHALKRFSAACDQAGMKISTTKTELLCPPWKPSQCALHVIGNILQQVEKCKYFGVVFTSNGKQNKNNVHGLKKQRQFYVN